MATKRTNILTAGTNNKQTTAEELNSLATDFISAGVLGALGNTLGLAPMTGGFGVNASAGMTIAVNAGVMYIQTTPDTQASQMLRSYMNASENVVIAANASGGTRYDWLYGRHNSANANNPNTAGDNVLDLYVSRSTSNSVDNNAPPAYGKLLAIITVPNGAVTIANSQIRDMRTSAVINTSTNAGAPWNDLSAYTITYASNNGNGEYVLNTSADLSSFIPLGSRFKISRTVTPPTQSGDFESSSLQYANKAAPAGLVFTDDFTLEAWVEVESYVEGVIVARKDATDTNGFDLRMLDTGQVMIVGLNGGGANLRYGISTQSLPLNQRVHVAATLNMSANVATIYINGTLVPSSMVLSGTNPTSIVQSGDLAIGRNGSANSKYFDGRISGVRIWNVIRTAAEIRDNMNQTLVGNETNLVGYFKVDGNFNDLTANANNLTAVNGAIATYAANPMNAIEMGLVTKISSTQITLFTGTDFNIPNMPLTSPAYSTHYAPYGFPTDPVKWRLTSILRQSVATTSNATYGSFLSGGWGLYVPIGAWKNIGWIAGSLYNTTTTSVVFALSRVSLVGMTVTQGNNTTKLAQRVLSPVAGATIVPAFIQNPESLTAGATYSMYTIGATAGGGIDGTLALAEIFAESAYV